MRLTVLLAVLSTLFALSGCAPSPPPRWEAGGAPLVIAPARWDRPDHDAIQIRANGDVYRAGDFIMKVDRVGRVVDDSYDPLAILLPRGRVIGTDDRALGRVGFENAALPGSPTAWFSILPNGQVIRFNQDGDRVPDGVWRGCSGPQMRTCALVTHILLVREYVNRPTTSVGVGIGIGF
jgi:hypothetical protein